jgi:hypothetical protein
MAGFWAGFGEELSSRVRERQQFAREKAEEQRRYLREQGLKRKAETDKLVQSITASASYLKNSGLDEERVKYLVDRDPMALETLAKIIQDATEEGRTISASTLNEAVGMIDSYVAPDKPLSQVIQERFSAFAKATPSDRPEKRNNSFLAAMMGYDTDTIDKVYEEPMFGTYTGADVAASIGTPMFDVSTAGEARLDLSGMVEPDRLSVSQISAAASDLKGMIKDIQDQTLTALRRSEASPEEIKRASEQPWTIPAVRDQVDRYVALFDERIYDILGPNYRPVEEEEGGAETPVATETEVTLTPTAAPAAPAAPPPSANPDDYRYFASEAAAEEFAKRDPAAWRRMPYVNIGGQVVQNEDYTGM